jgi:N-formylglutamate amidohydrolase
MMNETLPFHRLGPARPASPVILAVPHAGRIYPPELIAAAAMPLSRLEALEDRFADLLVTKAVDDGATAFVARHARAWIDLNRDEREIDPAMIDGLTPPPHAIGSARVRGGLGLIPRRIGGGGDIYRRRLTMSEVAQRIASDHRPWHAALAEALAEARARFGVAVLLDCHSMPPITRDAAREPPRLVIGDRYGRSAASRFVDRIAEIGQSEGVGTGRNSPYAGGHTLDRHGRPGSGIHAIQIEIDRSLYLAPDMRAAGPGMAQVRILIARLVAALADEALNLPPALAAE